jgi:hypothetical protein
MRDWLYHMADIAIDAMEQKRAQKLDSIEKKT